MKIMTILSEIRKSFILTVIFFTCIIIMPFKNITDEEIDKIIRKWVNEK
jgi:hypothetical protein